MVATEFRTRRETMFVIDKKEAMPAPDDHEQSKAAAGAIAGVAFLLMLAALVIGSAAACVYSFLFT